MADQEGVSIVSPLRQLDTAEKSLEVLSQGFRLRVLFKVDHSLNVITDFPWLVMNYFSGPLHE